MHSLRHFYYQNKEKIWKVVLIIAFLLAIIYFLNWMAIKDASKNQNQNQTQTNQDIYSDSENKTYISNSSAISGGSISKEDVALVNNTISKFLQYCKNGEIENAYNMLSNDCKQNEYNTLEKFKEKYISSKFSKTSIYEIERWISDTYKITISEDMLATGKIESGEKKVEYITIVNEDAQEKLNVNSYIGKQSIEKDIAQNEVKITAVSKRIYLDYEIYDLEIENLSNKTIKLDPLAKTGTMYLQNSKNIKYRAYAHEIFENDLEIKAKHKSKLSIKYAVAYSESTEIEKIVFEDVILDFIEYKKSENKKEFQDRCSVEINIK